jgi:tetratricopeptide (TPR) repeat protein
MSQNPRASRVKGGPPLWLWGMLIFATVLMVIRLIVSAVPEDPAQLYQGALQELNGGSKDEFLRTLNRLKQYPEYSDHITLLRGIQAAHQSRDPKAIDFFKQVQTNVELKSMALQKMGESLARMGDFPEAIEKYKEAIRSGPKTADQSRLMLARLYQVVGALTLAESTLTEIIAGNNAHITARRMRAQVRTSLFRYTEAAEDYSGTLTTPGDIAAASPEAISQYTICLMKTGDTEKMAAFAKQNLNLVSENSLKARLLFEGGDLDGARVILSGAPPEEFNSQPELAKLRLEIAVHDGEILIAKKHLPEGLAQMPRDDEFFRIATAVYKATGDLENAEVAEQNVQQLEDLQKQLLEALVSAGNNIDDVDARFQVATLYAKTGRYSDARQWFLTGGNIDSERASEAQQLMMEQLQLAAAPLVEFEHEASPQAASEAKDSSAEADESSSDEKPQDAAPESTEGNENK